MVMTLKLDLFKGEKLKREARQGKEVSPETRKELVELLSKAFPGVKVFDNVEAFEKNINQPGVVKRQTKDGYIAYGAKGDSSIYLNPDDKTNSLLPRSVSVNFPVFFANSTLLL